MVRTVLAGMDWRVSFRIGMVWQDDKRINLTCPKNIKTMKRLEILQKELKTLEAKYHYLTPAMVLDAAKSKNSPLHSFFEWDNENAGEQYRLWQARQYITYVRVNIGEIKTKAYESIVVHIKNKKHRRYLPIERILSDEEMYLQVVEGALREIQFWKSKYKMYRDLIEIVNADVEEKVKRKVGIK